MLYFICKYGSINFTYPFSHWYSGKQINFAVLEWKNDDYSVEHMLTAVFFSGPLILERTQNNIFYIKLHILKIIEFEKEKQIVHETKKFSPPTKDPKCYFSF